MSNHISIVAGTTKKLAVRLVGRDGLPVPAWKLKDASAVLDVRVQPTDLSDVLQFTTAGTPMSLSFDPVKPTVYINFAPGDTSSLTVASYFYQLVVTLSDGSVLDVIPWDLFDVTLGGSSVTPPPPFPNTVSITADYPLPHDMQYQTPGGSPICNAQVRVYLKSDYDAGRLNSPVGITTTDAFGNWLNPILVVPGFTYTARLEVPGAYGPDVKSFYA